MRSGAGARTLGVADGRLRARKLIDCIVPAGTGVITGAPGTLCGAAVSRGAGVSAGGSARRPEGASADSTMQKQLTNASALDGGTWRICPYRNRHVKNDRVRTIVLLGVRAMVAVGRRFGLTMQRLPVDAPRDVRRIEG